MASVTALKLLSESLCSRPLTELPIESDADRVDMERLAAGHDAALNNLMERHGPKLFNYLIRCLQNEEDAADAAQETFVRIYQNRTKFDARQRFSTWLYAIATNLVKDRYRYRARHPQVSLDAENPASGGNFQETFAEQRPTPSDQLEVEERAQTVRRAIGALPEELRTPLILSEYEELSHAEIAQILGCSPKAVETRLYRARQHLRVSLANLLERSANGEDAPLGGRSS
jgi:RNA polymerase sigma-70 factor, ECF subfamily